MNFDNEKENRDGLDCIHLKQKRFDFIVIYRKLLFNRMTLQFYQIITFFDICNQQISD